MNRYTLETNLSFQEVSAAIEAAKPRVMILTDVSSQVGGVTIGKAPLIQRYPSLFGLLILCCVVGILVAVLR